MEQVKEEILGERRKEKEEWKEEKKFEKRLEDLEWRDEKKEREKRKNNIVIKEIKQETGNLEEEVKNQIKEEMKMEVEIKKAVKIGKREDRKIAVAEVSQLGTKKRG